MTPARRCRVRGVAASLGLIASGFAHAAPPRGEIAFEVSTELGDESAWTRGYLERAARVMVRMMDAPDLEPPARVAVTLRLDRESQGVGGAATATTLEFVSNVWPEERWRYWILGHELANLLAHHYGGAGGYPADWWANGRSPFPLYLSTLAMAALGHLEEAAWCRGLKRGQPDHELFWVLHRRFGFDLFARFFRTIRADRVDLGKIGKPWPNADRTRSLYAVAYLSVAAGENLAPVFRAHGIGTKPSDWDAIHPDKPFVPYEVTDDAVGKVVEARARLFGGSGKATAAVEAQRERFRRGEPASR
jgi:hypothetical protein